MKLKLSVGALFLALVLGVGLAAQSQSAHRLKPLPGGAWTLAARESGQALLVPKPERTQGLKKGSPQKAGEPKQALLLAPGSAPTLIAARSRGLFAAGPDSQPQVWSTQFAGRKILFNPIASGPALNGVPENAGDYIFSSDGTVWSLRSGGRPQKLAADSAAGFSREELAAGAGVEQDVDLIWATNPHMSPDGRFIAYVSNREAVHARSAGQSVWLVDYASGHEQALLDGDGQSFAPLGWMGGELLFTDNRGGVSAVDPVSGEIRQVCTGTLLAADATGGVAAVLEGDLPGNRRLELIKDGRRTNVARRARWEYAGTADFSPDGSRLAVVLSARDGSKQIQVVEVSTGESQLLPLPGPRREALTDPPRWVDDQTLLVTTSLRQTGEERSSLLTVPESNAR